MILFATLVASIPYPSLVNFCNKLFSSSYEGPSYLNNVILHCHITLSYYTFILHNIVLHNIVLHNIVLHNIVLHNIVLHNINYTILHNIILHNTILHNIIEGGDERKNCIGYDSGSHCFFFSGTTSVEKSTFFPLTSRTAFHASVGGHFPLLYDFCVIQLTENVFFFPILTVVKIN
jgi:hypothetical protein